MTTRWFRQLVVLAPLLTLSLAGCLSDQKRDAATCSIESAKAFPNATTATVFDAAGVSIRNCMAAKGYSFTFKPDDCQPTGWTMQNVYCYEPAGRLSWLFYRLEMRLEQIGILARTS
jgi:hypothetical protein